MLADILKKNKVDNSGIRFDPGARTALAFVTLRADGEREFMFYRNPSADMLLKESELDIDLIKKVNKKQRKILWARPHCNMISDISVFAAGIYISLWLNQLN